MYEVRPAHRSTLDTALPVVSPAGRSATGRPTRRAAVRARALIVAAAVLAGVAAAPSPARAQDTPCSGEQVEATGPVQWCGTTTLKGTGGERFVLDLPQQASLDLGQTTLPGRSTSTYRDVTWTGSAPLSGVSIYTADTRIGPGALCESVLEQGCAGGNVTLHHWGPGFEGTINADNGLPYGSLSAPGRGNPSDPVVLPAGRYIVFLVSDGTPTSVRVRLTGATGRATYTSRERVGLEYGFLRPMAYPEQQMQVGSYGATERIASGAREIFTAIANIGVAGVTESEFCSYESAAPAPAEASELAYTKGCPLTRTTPGRNVGVSVTQVERLEFTARRGAGTSAFGFNHVAARPITKTLGFRFSLDVSEFASPSATAPDVTQPATSGGAETLLLPPVRRLP